MQNRKDFINYFILPCIASVIAIAAAFIPNDWYALKIIGIVIYTVIVFRSTITKIRSKHKPPEKREK